MLREIKSRIRRTLIPPLHKATIRRSYVFLGTEYGGWPLLKSTAQGSLIYSFGVGEDISFDLGAIERFSAEVQAFDPTPKSKSWIEQQALPESFTYHPIGIAARDGEAKFAPPVIEGHVSFSSTVARSEDVKGVIVAPVKSLRTIIDQLGRIEPAIIKMDIEGFEYEVVADLLRGDVRPMQLLVEFHHDYYGYNKKDTRQAVQALLNAGYEIFYVSSSGREYAFCNRSAL